MENQNFKLELGEKELKVEMKNLAELAAGSCLVQYGETLVLATAVISEREVGGIDFFPLTVDYEERYYAAGKILGARYIRRESRPTDEAIITSRMIDRTIRPLFPKDLKREVQIVATCLSWDRENDPDIIGLIGASTALSISEIPWPGPIAAARIGQIDGTFILNPTYEQREKSKLDLVLTGIERPSSKTAPGEILINMLEAEAAEVPEEIILKAVDFAKPFLKKLIDFQNQIVKKIGKEKIKIEEAPADPELEKEIKKFLGARLEESLFQKEKRGRMDEVNELKKELSSFIESEYPEKLGYARDFFEKEIEKLIRRNIINPPAGGEKRTDGRKLDEIREISCEVGLLPRTHGSGLFCRGQTKALSILTLGAPGDVKLLEGMEIVAKKRFMHHYNFPPYSVGEVKPIRGPGRRDIGHGMLAEKALLPIIPSFEQFPYTVRIVSEILSSNGSTSMASVSSSSLALMDAGVPIKTPVAGISLGLITDGKGGYKILTDIQGPEDHHGEMDFKVAGTEEGVCAIQMDVKIAGINEKILKEALEQGKRARLQILEKMKKVLEKPRPELSPFAPRILTLQINPEKIREVIGPGGKVINEIIKECEVSIDVEEDGKIFVTAEKEESAKKAIAWIKNITREIKVGEVFQGKIKRILDFGAFAEILPGQEGLIHISQLAPYRVEKVEDVVRIGDIVQVKVISIDEQGRINLSLRAPKNKMVEEIEEKKEFLKREEIRTMAKDLSRLRETEAQKERERIAALKLEEKREKITPPEIPGQPAEIGHSEEALPKTGRPKSFQKILVRAVFCFLFILIIGFWGWFFGIRKPAVEEIIPPSEEIIPPAEEVPPEEKLPGIIVPPSLISVSETKVVEISKNEEIPGKMSKVFAENLTSGALTRIIIKNITENRLSSLEDLSQVSQIETPEEILQKLESDFTLAIFPQKQGKRVVLLAKTKEDLTGIFKNWEKKIEKEGVFLVGQKIAALVPYFRSASYQSVAFRYLTISKEDSGICYALFKNYFIFTTSFESLKKTIEELKKEEELSLWKIKVGQLFVVGFEGKEITPKLEEFIKKYKPGGVLLLSKNIESKEQLKNLISELQEISLRETGFQLFIAVDQEGGMISRIGFLEEKTPQSEIKTPEAAYQIGQIRGGELKELGVNLNLAPILDTAGSSDFLFSRSFQKSASGTGELAESLILGQKAAGVLTAMKHFPGYSGIAFNPEGELGIRADVPEISQFKKAMEAVPELVMTSNVVYQSIDALLPFTLSAKAIQYLKNNLGEKILIISDDLDQNSLLNKFSLKEIVIKPVEAGVDILIFSGYRLPAENGLDAFWQAFQNGEVLKEKIETAYSKIIQLKQKLTE